ncbi:isoliquiritigenin 2'-O-methyltransferase-like [Prosopis cineraria]|uniref:isoliquiritigenin 2'-O-methyltransferase-like n=1 Tax=Prosopis cineraria TaxID=364024 RepID=UPI00241022CC|nr:isoliquiritigenin 2'-O-methyltransferase-like [Prosopis cineraria]
MVAGDENNDACLDALWLSSGQVYPAVLNAAIELNLFEIIGRGNPKGMSPSEIASELPTQDQHPDTPQRLDRMLFLLASHSLLSWSKQRFDEDEDEEEDKVERLYRLSPTGSYLIADDDHGASFASLSKLCCHPAYIKVWQNFKEVINVDEEDLFKKVHGMSMFEYMETDPSFKPLFHRAMADISAMHMRKILETYKGFEVISTLVDVAGGIGQSLKMITSKYPSIKGINFDLPQVVQHAPSYPGVTHVGGDMFKSIPEGDAIMIKAATHNWSDEKCVQVLKNCHKSLKKGGKVILIDLIMPEIPKASDGDKYVTILDNVMFLQAGGKERTEKEFAALCKSSGFSGYQIAASVFSVLGVIEFYK